MADENYKEKLKDKMKDYAHFVYQVTKSFPREEFYGTTSQLRRASLSVVLNYIEGYARRKKLVMLNFLEISYGSLQESKFLLNFSFIEGYLNKEDYDKATEMAEEIGAMLWTEITNLDQSKY